MSGDFSNDGPGCAEGIVLIILVIVLVYFFG